MSKCRSICFQISGENIGIEIDGGGTRFPLMIITEIHENNNSSRYNVNVPRPVEICPSLFCYNIELGAKKSVRAVQVEIYVL